MELAKEGIKNLDNSAIAVGEENVLAIFCLCGCPNMSVFDSANEVKDISM